MGRMDGDMANNSTGYEVAVEWRQKCEMFERENDKIASANLRLQDDRDKLKAECERLRNDHANLKLENEKLTREVQRLGVANDRLEGERDRLACDFTEVAVEWRQKCEQFEAQNQELDAQLLLACKDYDAAVEVIRHLAKLL